MATAELGLSFDRKPLASLDDLRREQDKAVRSGLVTDPKSTPRGGFRVACTWSEEVADAAWRLSKGISKVVPGAPAYPHDSIHSSIGNLLAPGKRIVRPEGRQDARTLQVLCRAVESVLASSGTGSPADVCRFGPALVVPRMAVVFGQADSGFYRLQEQVLRACWAAGVKLEPSWGPHLTLTRFGRPASPSVVRSLLELLDSWSEPVMATMTGVAVGYYTVNDGFSVTTVRSFPVG